MRGRVALGVVMVLLGMTLLIGVSGLVLSLYEANTWLTRGYYGVRNSIGQSIKIEENINPSYVTTENYIKIFYVPGSSTAVKEIEEVTIQVKKPDGQTNNFGATKQMTSSGFWCTWITDTVNLLQLGKYEVYGTVHATIEGNREVSYTQGPYYILKKESIEPRKSDRYDDQPEGTQVVYENIDSSGSIIALAFLSEQKPINHNILILSIALIIVGGLIALSRPM